MHCQHHHRHGVLQSPRPNHFGCGSDSCLNLNNGMPTELSQPRYPTQRSVRGCLRRKSRDSNGNASPSSSRLTLTTTARYADHRARFGYVSRCIRIGCYRLHRLYTGRPLTLRDHSARLVFDGQRSRLQSPPGCCNNSMRLDTSSTTSSESVTEILQNRRRFFPSICP